MNPFPTSLCLRDRNPTEAIAPTGKKYRYSIRSPLTYKDSRNFTASSNIAAGNFSTTVTFRIKTTA
ncbi:MAG TPA: hypothetical protein V6D35_14225 [Candidatus Sericytochromatia bacterium]